MYSTYTSHNSVSVSYSILTQGEKYLGTISMTVVAMTVTVANGAAVTWGASVYLSHLL